MSIQTKSVDPNENDGFVVEVTMEWNKLQFALADGDACDVLVKEGVLPSWFSNDVEHEKTVDWFCEHDEPEIFTVRFKDATRAEKFSGDLRKLLKEKANSFDAERTKVQARRKGLESLLERIESCQVDCDKLGLRTFGQAQKGFSEAKEQVLDELDKLRWLDARSV